MSWKNYENRKSNTKMIGKMNKSLKMNRNLTMSKILAE